MRSYPHRFSQKWVHNRVPIAAAAVQESLAALNRIETAAGHSAAVIDAGWFLGLIWATEPEVPAEWLNARKDLLDALGLWLPGDHANDDSRAIFYLALLAGDGNAAAQIVKLDQGDASSKAEHHFFAALVGLWEERPDDVAREVQGLQGEVEHASSDDYWISAHYTGLDEALLGAADGNQDRFNLGLEAAAKTWARSWNKREHRKNPQTLLHVRGVAVSRIGVIEGLRLQSGSPYFAHELLRISPDPVLGG